MVCSHFYAIFSNQAITGRVIISGNINGQLVISSAGTGMTVRVLHDHRTAAISAIEVSPHHISRPNLAAPGLWLAASNDRRVSVWCADWTKDSCELVDWLTFPAAKDVTAGSGRSITPSCRACFSPEDPDLVFYSGYSMAKELLVYSLSKKSFIHRVAVNAWPLCIDVAPTSGLIAIGTDVCQMFLLLWISYKFTQIPRHGW